MASFKEMYDKPLYNAAFTFLEPFPIGLLVTLISAGVLRTRARGAMRLQSPTTMASAADFLTMLVEGLGTSPSPQNVVDALVPEAADLAQMFVRFDDELRLVAFRHIDPDYHPVLQELAKVHRPSIHHPVDPVALVMRTGAARLSTWVRREHVERVTPDTRVHAMFDVLRPRNIVIVPLPGDSGCYGALVVVLSSSGRNFIEGDLEFMREFAARIGPTVRLS